MADMHITEGESAETSKVQEAAAGIHQPGAPLARRSRSEAERVSREYFQAINDRDLDAAVAMWAPGGRENVRGQVDLPAPEGVRAFIGDLLEAMPDLHFELLGTTTEGERCGVQWRLKGTFAGPGSFGGIAPTGHPVTLEGVDLLTVRDGLIHNNDAFSDTLAFPRQIGMMPPAGSAGEQRMMGAFNLKTRVTSAGMG
jgi:predicted ester cyclase